MQITLRTSSPGKALWSQAFLASGVLSP